MRVSRFLLLVGIVTMSSIFYIYQQSVAALRPLEKKIQRLNSFNFDYENNANVISAGNSITLADKINGESLGYNTKLQVAKK